MTAIAERIQKRLQSLPAARAARLEHLLEELLDFSEAEIPQKQTPEPPVTQEMPRIGPYEIKARPLGLRAGLSYDNMGELLAAVEGEGWK